MEEKELKRIQNLAKIKINLLNPYAMIAEAIRQELLEKDKEQEKPLQRNGVVL